VQKKMLWLAFAQEKQAQWIKAMVLTLWSRQAEQVSRAIDLKVWLDSQKWYSDTAFQELGEIKRSMEGAKLRNPDIATALEALTTGKASWMPDVRLDFIASEYATSRLTI
jgi:mediator of RNA polymerase II transcription subunit 14